MTGEMQTELLNFQHKWMQRIWFELIAYDYLLGMRVAAISYQREKRKEEEERGEEIQWRYNG